MQDTNFEQLGIPIGLEKKNSEQFWESTMNMREKLFQNKQLS